MFEKSVYFEKLNFGCSGELLALFSQKLFPSMAPSSPTAPFPPLSLGNGEQYTRYLLLPLFFAILFKKESAGEERHGERSSGSSGSSGVHLHLRSLGVGLGQVGGSIVLCVFFWGGGEWAQRASACWTVCCAVDAG